MGDYSTLAQAMQGDRPAAIPDQKISGNRFANLRAALMPQSNMNFDYPDMGSALNDTDQQARLAMYGPQAGLQANLRAETGQNWDNEIAAQPAREAAAASSLRDALLSLTPAAPVVAAKDAYNSARGGDWLGTALGVAGTLPLVGMAAKGVNEARIASRIHTTETPEFKNWFSASKIVDENSKPLVVYHGTKSDIDQFDIKKHGASDPGLVGKGFHFTYNPEEASGYAMNEMFGKGDAPNVIPAYVSIQNPFIISHGVLPDGRSVREIHNGPISAKAGNYIRKLAEDAGHDGIVFTNRNGDIRHAVAWSPEQIKSAIGNRGTFDPADPRLTYSIGGMGAATYGTNQDHGR